jgi:hypothetical protein
MLPTVGDIVTVAPRFDACLDIKGKQAEAVHCAPFGPNGRSARRGWRAGWRLIGQGLVGNLGGGWLAMPTSGAAISHPAKHWRDDGCY